MTEPQAERLFQDGKLAAERDGGRQMQATPYPEGTVEANWWHRGYDFQVLLEGRTRALGDRRTLCECRERVRELEATGEGRREHYEAELRTLRDHQSIREASYVRQVITRNLLKRIAGVLGQLQPVLAELLDERETEPKEAN
jgi:hypothetical protein